MFQIIDLSINISSGVVVTTNKSILHLKSFPHRKKCFIVKHKKGLKLDNLLSEEKC
jgi:hypothetical protein